MGLRWLCDAVEGDPKSSPLLLMALLSRSRPAGKMCCGPCADRCGTYCSVPHQPNEPLSTDLVLVNILRTEYLPTLGTILIASEELLNWTAQLSQELSTI